VLYFLFAFNVDSQTKTCKLSFTYPLIGPLYCKHMRRVVLLSVWRSAPYRWLCNFFCFRQKLFAGSARHTRVSRDKRWLLARTRLAFWSEDDGLRQDFGRP